MIPETWRSRLLRWRFNWFPAYRGTGGRVTYIAPDLREVHIKVPLTWRTRNYVGTIFGGSMYGAVDPFYMVMLINILGPSYVVWDKAAVIRFRRPGRTALRAEFIIDQAETDAIVEALGHSKKVDREYTVSLADEEGTVCAVVTKTIHVSTK